MRLHAILDNNIVTEILELDEALYAKEAAYHDLVLDVEDMIPRPEVGWVLEGNKLVPASAQMTQDQLDEFQQKAQRLFGLYLLPIAVDKIGARNLKLAREGTPTDVAALASAMASIKVLLEGGALKTVRGICGSIKPGFPHHSDILDLVINEITAFLTNNGWN